MLQVLYSIVCFRWHSTVGIRNAGGLLSSRLQLTLPCSGCAPPLSHKPRASASSPLQHMNSLLSSLRVEHRGGASSGGSKRNSTHQGQAGAPLQYDPIAEADPAVSKERCRSTRGDWCGRYLAQEPIPAIPPPQGNQTCLWKCNSVGTCDAMKGWCRCPAGWMGDDCSTRMKVCAAACHPTAVSGKHHTTRACRQHK